MNDQHYINMRKVLDTEENLQAPLTSIVSFKNETDCLFCVVLIN